MSTEASAKTTASAPAASAARSTVPALPGSRTFASSATRTGAGRAAATRSSGTSTKSHTASRPCGVTVCASSLITSPLTSWTSTPAAAARATRPACRIWAGAVTKSPLIPAPAASASVTACGPSARKARSRCRSARLVSRRAALSRGLRTLVYSVPLPSGSGTAWLGRQVRPGHLDQRGERGLVGHGQLGQHAPVDFDLGRLQTLDEAVVGDAVGPGRRVDPLDPQPPEGALAVLAVAVGVGHRVELLLLGLAVQPGPLAPVTAGPLEDRAALLLGVGRPLDACHCSVTPSARGRVTYPAVS